MAGNASFSEQSNLDILRSFAGQNCIPSPASIDELRAANVVLVSGQIVGGGKSTFINELKHDGRINIPSWTNRDLRPGEVEGVDKMQRSLDAMAEAALSGYFLELEEVRPGTFYATPGEFTSGQQYVKDLELRGALRLRSLDPAIPVIVPLPPIDTVVRGVTEWERRVAEREGYHKAVSEKSSTDLKARLAGVVEETERIHQTDLVDDPNTLFVVNDDLGTTMAVVHEFLETRRKPQDAASLALRHVIELGNVAAEALEAA